MGEHRIREMNDEINKMMRQKHHWEVRIRELGGDVQKGRQFYDIEGKELPGAPGYKYYGAAKELPGVRELFAEGEEEVHSRRHKRYNTVCQCCKLDYSYKECLLSPASIKIDD